jgi:hypothetical protein
MVLEGLVPYHTREKMHRVRGTGAKKQESKRDNGIPSAA